MNSLRSLFIPIEKVFLEGKKKEHEGNKLIKIRKFRRVVLYHETPI